MLKLCGKFGARATGFWRSTLGTLFDSAEVPQQRTTHVHAPFPVG
jgi:hypothetical protein